MKLVAARAASPWAAGAPAVHRGWEALQSSLLRLCARAAPLGPGQHPEDYELFQHQDTASWIVFFVFFFVLVIFDNVVLHRGDKPLSFKKALLFSLFWLVCAAVFNVYVYMARGKEDAFDWATGYLLEWMLSVDNLFVFRSIFMVLKTPDDQKHKPLFWGIVGAIVFRMAFFVVEELLVHTFWWMYIPLGAFLVWTGYKVAFQDEDEADPLVYREVVEHIPYTDSYAGTPRFFVHRGSEDCKDPGQSSISPPGTPSSAEGKRGARGKLVATRLLLVVICLEITDVIFAVDSVTAIVGQIPDLFLAYTACVFAMLGLRATFFVVDELVKLFTLLPYAVAGILAFIGVKLMLRQWVHVPPGIVCGVILSALTFSILGSVLLERWQGKSGCDACCQAISCNECCPDRHQGPQLPS